MIDRLLKGSYIWYTCLYRQWLAVHRGGVVPEEATCVCAQCWKLDQFVTSHILVVIMMQDQQHLELFQPNNRVGWSLGNKLVRKVF